MIELFSISDLSDLRQLLTPEEKDALIDRIIRFARLGRQYMYDVREAAGLMHISYDEIQTLLNFYKLDCTVIKDTIVRIPWWSLAEYLIDPAEDVENALQEYLKTLPHREPEKTKIA